MYEIRDDATVYSLKIASLAPSVVSPAVLLTDKTVSFQDAPTFRDLIAAEARFPNPSTSGWILSSTTGGIRSWVAPNAHSHAISDVTGLQSALDAKTSLALGETSTTAYRGDRGKTAYYHSQITAANPHGTTFAQIASTPTTLEGYGITDAQAALGYTPANRAGDTFTGQVVVTDPTNVFAQPKLIVSVGGGSASGEVGFHSDGASVGNKNWGAGVSRDFSCFRIMSYSDDWSGHSECIRVGTDYLDLSNAYADVLKIGYKICGQKVVGVTRTGWGAPTGTATRTTFATSTVTTAQLAERVKALIDDLISHGLIAA